MTRLELQTGQIETIPDSNTDWTGILDYAAQRRARRVEFSGKAFTSSQGVDWKPTGTMEIIGKAGTEFNCDHVAPIAVQEPSMAGYPASRTVTTGALALLLRDTERKVEEITFENIKWNGLRSTPTAAGDFSLVSLTANRVKFRGCRWRNETSNAIDTSAISKYKSLSARASGMSLNMVSIGVDKWIEPYVDLARPVEQADFQNCELYFEPLNETSNGVHVVRGFHLRKVGKYNIQNIKFGEFHDGRNAISADVIINTNPSDGDTLTINAYNPFTRTVDVQIYEFDNDSSVTSGNVSVTIGATKLITSRNLASAINTRAAQADTAGYFAIAQHAEGYLGDATISSIRVEGLFASGSSNILCQPQMWYPGDSFVTTSSSGISILRINTGQSRTLYGQFGFFIEDSMPGIVSGIQYGKHNIQKSFIYHVATSRHNTFGLNQYSEDSHKRIEKIVGEGMTAGVAVIHGQGSGFDSVGGCEIGQTTVGTNASPGSVLRCEPGVNYETKIAFSGAATDGDTITFADSINTRVFTFKNKPQVTVTITATPADGSEITVKPIGIRKARFIFKSGPPSTNDPDAGIFWIDTVSANATTIAQLFKTLLGTIYGSSGIYGTNSVTTSGAAAVITVTDASYGDGSLLCVEVADTSNKIAIATIRTGSTDAIYHVDLAATAQLQAVNLRKKTWLAIDAHTLKCVLTEPASGALYARFFTHGVFASAPTITKSCSAITLTNYNMPYRTCATMWDDSNVVHWVQTPNGFGAPLTYVDKAYESVRIGGKWDHIRGMNPVYSSHAWGVFRFSGALANADAVVIDSGTDAARTFTAGGTSFTQGATGATAATALAAAINAAGESYSAFASLVGSVGYVVVVDGKTGADSAFLAQSVDTNNVIDTIFGATIDVTGAISANTPEITFNLGSTVNVSVKFKSGVNSDTSTEFFIDYTLTGQTTAAQQAAALAAKLNDVVSLTVAALGGFMYAAVDPTGTRVFVFSSLPQDNNTLFATETSDPDNKLTIRQYLAGSSDASHQGLRSPFVFKDCGQVLVTAELHPFMDSGYGTPSAGDSTDPVFGDNYSAQLWFTSLLLDTAFAYMSMKPIFIQKSSTDVASKLVSDGKFFGPFGKGALAATAQPNTRAVLVGSNMVSGDIKATGTYIDGSILP